MGISADRDHERPRKRLKQQAGERQMARISTIKPEFFRDPTLYQLEKDSGLPIRVAFAGLWVVADREGRFKWEPKVIKLDVLPWDDVEFDEVLNVLERGGRIIKYTVGGKTFGVVKNFTKHQRVNNREAPSTLPPPPEDGRKNMKSGKNPKDPVKSQGSKDVNSCTGKIKARAHARESRSARVGTRENLDRHASARVTAMHVQDMHACPRDTALHVGKGREGDKSLDLSSSLTFLEGDENRENALTDDAEPGHGLTPRGGDAMDGSARGADTDPPASPPGGSGRRDADRFEGMTLEERKKAIMLEGVAAGSLSADDPMVLKYTNPPPPAAVVSLADVPRRPPRAGPGGGEGE
jgi:hypothetical protein